MIEEARPPRDGGSVPLALALTVPQLDRLICHGFASDPWLTLVAIEVKMRLLGLERRNAEGVPPSLAGERA